MSRDLNLKKSWHPGLLKNQEAVWKREQEALEERKKIAERQKEIARERERDELLRMQDAGTGRKRARKLEWMYSEANGGSMGKQDEEESEAYLLGKKRINVGKLEGPGDFERLQTDNGRFRNQNEKEIQLSQAATLARMKQDPMYLIKQKQMETARKQAADKSEHEKTEKRDRIEREKKNNNRQYDDRERDYDRKRNQELRGSVHDYETRRRYTESYESKGKSSDIYERKIGYKNRNLERERERDRNLDREKENRYSSRSYDQERRESYRHDRYGREKRTEHDARTRHSDRRSYERSNRELSPRRSKHSDDEYKSRHSDDEATKKLAAMSNSAKELELKRQHRIQVSMKNDSDEKKRDDEMRMASIKNGHNQFIQKAGRNLFERTTKKY